MKPLLRSLNFLFFIGLVFLSLSCSKSNTIKVGVVLPLSGDNQELGNSLLVGIETRIGEINAAGGINDKQIEMIKIDNAGKSDQTIIAYEKFVLKNKCEIVIGPLASGNANAVRDKTAELKVPMITPSATNDNVTKSDYMFRACFVDAFQGEVIAKYAATSLGIKKTAVLIDAEQDYSIGLAESFTKHFTKLGGEVVAKEEYKGKSDNEFGPQLLKIKKSGAKLLLVPGYPANVPLIIKQAKINELDCTICGGDSWDTPEIVTKSEDGIIGSFIVTAFSQTDKRPIVQNFIKSVKAKFKKDPGSWDALGYDTVSLVESAIKSEGEKAEEIKEGLLAIKNFEAVTGFITITPEGNAVKDAVVNEVKKEDGKFVQKWVKTVKP